MIPGSGEQLGILHQRLTPVAAGEPGARRLPMIRSGLRPGRRDGPMDNRVTLRPQLPQLRELESHPSRVTREGARATPQADLQTRVPDLGPFTLGNASFYHLQVYPGPLLKVVAATSSGQQVDLSA